jgi:hypothetical protein
MVADANARVNVDAFAQGAIAAYYSLLAHLAMLPDFGAFAKTGLRRNIGSRMNKELAFHRGSFYWRLTHSFMRMIGQAEHAGGWRL